MGWLEYIALLLLNKILIHSSFDSRAFFTHFEVYCVGNLLFNTRAINAFFLCTIWILDHILSGFFFFFFFKIFNFAYNVFYYSWFCISFMLHSVICSLSWLRLAYSKRSVVSVHRAVTFLSCMGNCFSLLLLLDTVFGCSVKTFYHFVTKMRRRFEFTLTSLIGGVIFFCYGW